MAITIGSPCVFGVVDQKPMIGFPAGKIRLRLRPDEFARAFVRNETHTLEFAIKEENGAWLPLCLNASNIRVKASISSPISTEKRRRFIVIKTRKPPQATENPNI